MKFTKFLPFIILFFTVLSIFLVKFTYFSLGLSIITFILCLIFSRKNTRVFLITTIVCIATIVTDGIILYKEYRENIDIFDDKNILLGNWSYNNDGGTYIFKDDYTYIEYSNYNTTDTYCIGEYRYSYGGSGDNGTIIKQDENYYYYDLTLIENSCTISGKEMSFKKENKFVFGVNKDDYDDLVFMDVANNSAFRVTKITN